MTENICSVCATKALEVRAKRQGLLVYACMNCGLLVGRAGEKTAQGARGAIETSPDHFQMLIDKDELWRTHMDAILARRLPYIEERLQGPANHWLEIGPGNGGMEAILKSKNKYWQGVEIDPVMAARMKSTGKKVVEGDFSEIDITNFEHEGRPWAEGFDVVFFSQVFEHVVNPTKFLDNAFKCLRPGGVVYVDVPNNDGLTSFLRKANPWSLGYGEIVPPHHMLAYGRKTLTRALKGAGFEAPDVFAKPYNEPTFGLVHGQMERRLRLRLAWFASRAFGAGGNLVGIAKEPVSG